jgi:hypothetical protein
MSNIHDLREVIKRLHGAEAKHVESVPVTETHQGRTVWDGVVEVFDLIGHPKTHRVYAWAHQTDEPGNVKHITVLHVPPVVSPQSAVRAAIIQEYRNNA